MSPTRRDTLKAAGAASGLAMLGGHAVAQQDTTDGDDDGPGAQTLEEGQGAVRVGHFVAGAPAVNVRLVPAEGTDADESDDDELGGNGTDDTNGTDNETGGNETGGVGDDNDTDDNESDDNTTEDLQIGDDNESDDNETGGAGDDNDTGGVGDDNDTGGVGDDNDTGGIGDDNDTDDGLGTDDGTTDDGEGELVAENVSFGDVSEYANVDAGDYTLQIIESEGETDSDVGEDDGAGDENGTGTTGGESDDDDIISLPPNMENEYPESENGSDNGSDNETGGANNESGDNTSEDLQIGDDNDTDDNETGGVGDDNDTDDNETGGVGDDNDTDDNETDDGLGTTDDSVEEGEVIHEEEITVGETFYTAAAVGESEDEIEVHVLRDYDAAQVRLVHASPDAPGVDVTADDANMTLFDGVQFGQATEYVGVTPGSYSVTVREEAPMNDGDEVDTFDAEFDTGEAYSVYAIGSPEGGDEEFDLVVQQDGQGADGGLGQDDAPGQQDDSPGQGEPGGPGDDNETGTGQDDAPGQQDDSPGQGEPGGPGDDNETGDDEPGAGGPGADDEEPNGGNLDDDNDTETEEDDGGILAF